MFWVGSPITRPYPSDRAPFAPVSNSRTVLPAPRLLNLIGVRADENAVTLIARASPRVARCPVSGKRSVRVDPRYTRTLADLPWQRGPRDRPPARPKVFLRRGDLRQGDLCGAFVRRRRTLWSQDRTTRRLVHTRLLRPRERSRVWGLSITGTISPVKAIKRYQGRYLPVIRSSRQLLWRSKRRIISSPARNRCEKRILSAPARNKMLHKRCDFA